MALFSRTTLESLRPLLLRVARVEATRLDAPSFRQRGPFAEERLRLLGPWAQDVGVAPADLARRMVAEPEATFDEALRWRDAIDAEAEASALEEDAKRLGRTHRKLVAEMLGYVGRGDRFGAGGPVDKMRGAFADLDGYIAYSPSRRGLLGGRIAARKTIGGLELNTLEDEVYTARYSYDFRGVSDKLWDDLTYVRPAALEFDLALTRAVLEGEAPASPNENSYMQRARALFAEAYGGDLDAALSDLEWWIVRELIARRAQRMQMRRNETVELIGNLSLAPGGAHYDVYWVFDEVLAPLEVLLECKQTPGKQRRATAFAIDRLIRFEPPASAAAFHYDTNLMLAEAALTDDPVGRIANRLRGLTDFEDYHQLLRDAWATIQHLMTGGSIRVSDGDGSGPPAPDAAGAADQRAPAPGLIAGQHSDNGAHPPDSQPPTPPEETR